MQYHTGNPGRRNTHGEQADDLQQSSEYGFTPGTVAAVHDIVAGADGSCGQVDQDHVFPIEHGIRPQAEQGQHRSV